MQEKVQRLCEVIKEYDRVAVCLSGGSDSSLVAIAAVKALGRENVVGVTVDLLPHRRGAGSEREAVPPSGH